ncbi:hypothetical protein [Variovorax sp. LG9.2]|uniref:hypothetical protein n=1 Tax=Variovorax sp. LG9.2 TaxID=3048626 RepID=UPI002B22F9B4|nr:hypothetical protein [Variovorax sp. LG9.2]MEB0057314.1 hypothetical protein [Variovorax sp. LG9.2]
MQRKPRGQIFITADAPSPTKGLNTRDPVAVMLPTYANIMNNMIAANDGVRNRKGCRVQASGLGPTVGAVMPYNATGSGTSKLFAASGTQVFDVTTAGAVGAAVGSALTTDQLDYVQFAGAAGQYLVMCNGADAARHYESAAGWVNWSLVTTPSTPGQVSGVDPSKLSGVISHQRRLWFIEKNTTRVWYTPINSIGGALNQFEFGPYLPRGGFIQAIGSWSMDAGKGIQNYLVAVSNQGDAVLYEGSDVSDATNWKLTGTWALSPPVGRDCFTQYGADLLYLCTDGLLPFSTYLQSTLTTSALTDAIRRTIQLSVSTTGTLPGWSLTDTGNVEGLLVLNVPANDPSQTVQAVQHKQSGGWSTFTGWPAQCWAVQGKNIYFGKNGYVMQAFVGYTDNQATDGTSGTTYTCTCSQAYNYFADALRYANARTVNKQYKQVCLNIISASVAPAIRIGLSTTPGLGGGISTSSTAPPTNGGSVFGVARWGTGVFSGTQFPINQWQFVRGVGTSASLQVEIKTQAEFLWTDTLIRFARSSI